MQPMLLYPRRSRFAPTKRYSGVIDEKEHTLKLSVSNFKRGLTIVQFRYIKNLSSYGRFVKGFYPNFVRLYYIKGKFSRFFLSGYRTV